jgi:hypothetical protein
VPRLVFRGFETRSGCLVNLVARLVLGLGLLLSGYAILTAGPTVRLTYGATIVAGTVVRQIEEYRPAAPVPGMNQAARGPKVVSVVRTYRAVAAFRSGERTYEVRSQRAGDAPIYATGSSIDVAFPPAQPARARFRDEIPGFWQGAGLLLVGIMVGAGAVRWWWRMSHGRATIPSLPGGRSDVLGG